MLIEIPLTDDERAAVEGDKTAVGRLIDLLADVATPAGPASRSPGETSPRKHPIRTRRALSSSERNSRDEARQQHRRDLFSRVFLFLFGDGTWRSVQPLLSERGAVNRSIDDDGTRCEGSDVAEKEQQPDHDEVQSSADIERRRGAHRAREWSDQGVSERLKGERTEPVIRADSGTRIRGDVLLQRRLPKSVEHHPADAVPERRDGDHGKRRRDGRRKRLVR